MAPKVGDQAPAFTALDQNGQSQTLQSYRGHWLLLYFYPKDDTPGCTNEACSFRDHYDELTPLVKIVGVSTDSLKSHQKFAAKYHLPFPILVDDTKTLVGAYGVYAPKKFMGREYLGTHRTSVLINPEGSIAKIYPKVNPLKHVAEVLSDLKSFNSTAK